MNNTQSRINSSGLTNICRRKWECFSVCCLIAYSVKVNYECKVMNLFAKVIYPADLWSPGAKLIRACTQTACWICMHAHNRSQCAAIELHRYYYCSLRFRHVDMTKDLQCYHLFGETGAAFQCVKNMLSVQ